MASLTRRNRARDKRLQSLPVRAAAAISDREKRISNFACNLYFEMSQVKLF
jgi:hypothetical protein